MLREIEDFISGNIETQETLFEQIPQIKKAVDLITDCVKKKGKIILFGNGGSASDCQHIAAEFLGRYKKNRPALPAIALPSNMAVITAIANDFGYDNVFSKQLEAFASKKDVVIAISTSGNSKNVIEGIKESRKLGSKVVGLTGNNGGRMKNMCDILINVKSSNTPMIQQAHITIAHIICELVEKEVFKK